MFIDRNQILSRYQFFPAWAIDSNAIPVNIPESYFMDIHKVILKFIWREKRPRITNTILKEKNKVRRQTVPNFKTYYKTVVIKDSVILVR